MPDPFSAYVVPQDEDPFAAYAVTPPPEQAQPPAYIRSGNKTKAILGHLLSEEPATLGALGGGAALLAPIAGAGAGIASAVGAMAPAAGHLLSRGYRRLTGQAQPAVSASEVLDVAGGPAMQYGGKVIGGAGRFIAGRPLSEIREVMGALGAFTGHAAAPGYGTVGGYFAGRRLAPLAKRVAASAGQTRPATETTAEFFRRPPPPSRPGATTPTPSGPSGRAAKDLVERRVSQRPLPAGMTDRRVEELLGQGFGSARPAVASERAARLTQGVEGPLEAPLATWKGGAAAAGAETTQAMPEAWKAFVSKSHAPTVATLTENDVLALAAQLKTTPEAIRTAVTSARAGRSALYRTDAEVRKALQRRLEEP